MKWTIHRLAEESCLLVIITLNVNDWSSLLSNTEQMHTRSDCATVESEDDSEGRLKQLNEGKVVQCTTGQRTVSEDKSSHKKKQ